MNTANGQPFQKKAVRARQEPTYSVELLWLPLGARGHFIRIGGKVYETVAALLDRREMDDIYHSVLNVRVPGGRFVIEMGPVVDTNGAGRGVVAEGPVASRLVARFRIFRYEVRCWRDGITAYDYAVDSPRRITDDPQRARQVLKLVSQVPPLTWGRDQLGTGEMWSCNLPHLLVARQQRTRELNRATRRWPRARLDRGGGRRAAAASAASALGRQGGPLGGLTSAATLSPFGSTG